MLRLCGLSVLLLVFAAPAMAQVTPESTDQQTGQTETPPEAPVTPVAPRIFPKYDLSGGYIVQFFKGYNGGPGLTLQGWYGSVEYNFFSWLGAEGLFSGDYKNQPNGNGDISVYSAMAGPRIYPFRHHKLEPWGHFLYGGGVYVVHFPAGNGFHAVTRTYSSKDWDLGYGMDLNKWDHWGIRLIEIDYGRTHYLNPKGESNFTIAVGFTYRFGEK
jgi:hypothetical protein